MTSGGYPFNIVYSMPVYLRKFHLRYIASLKKKENKGSHTPSKILKPGIKSKK
jgi:hypothetical protein